MIARQGPFGGGPAAAHARQHKVWQYALKTRPGLSAVAFSGGGRDLVKVALYPAAAGLGNDAKKRCPSRKGRSKHSAHGLAVTSVAQATIDRPSGTGAA
jgi:hypothetical protein